MIRVRVERNWMGDVIVAPMSDKYAEMFARVAASNGGPRMSQARRDGFTCYFQGQAADEFVEALPERHQRTLESGWSIVFLADPWEVGHWYGYDAHTVAENGMSLKGMNL